MKKLEISSLSVVRSSPRISIIENKVLVCVIGEIHASSVNERGRNTNTNYVHLTVILNQNKPQSLTIRLR